MAIMGPSGAGKTTLLDILAGRLTRKSNTHGSYRGCAPHLSCTTTQSSDAGVANGAPSSRSVNGASGTVMVGGVELSRKTMQKMTAFVRQQDYLDGNDTVHEAVAFSAFMQMDRAIPRGERKEAVDRTIRQLGLTHARNSKVCQLSGGERRRVSVALQLVARPMILFMDEPTSGLDADNALKLCKCLRSLADAEGITVIVTIHQVSHRILRNLVPVLISPPSQPSLRYKKTKCSFFVLHFVCSSPPLRSSLFSTSACSYRPGCACTLVLQRIWKTTFHRLDFAPPQVATRRIITFR